MFIIFYTARTYGAVYSSGKDLMGGTTRTGTGMARRAISRITFSVVDPKMARFLKPFP